MAQDNFDDIEKLLEIAEDSQATVVFQNTVVEKFIASHKIEVGDTFVPNVIIYYTYHLWKPKRKLDRRLFFKLFKTHFESKIKSNTRGYLLNADAFDMSFEGLMRARAFQRSENVKRKKNKKKSG